MLLERSSRLAGIGSSSHCLPHEHHLVARLCCLCRSSLSPYDSFDSASFCRQRFWLFVAYVVSCSSIVGAAAVLLQHMSSKDGGTPPYVKWTGWVSLCPLCHVSLVLSLPSLTDPLIQSLSCTTASGTRPTSRSVSPDVCSRNTHTRHMCLGVAALWSHRMCCQGNAPGV
jgi:hypothetical protein